MEGGALAFGVEVAEGINSVGVLSYDLMNVLLANVVLEVEGAIDKLKWLADSGDYEVISNEVINRDDWQSMCEIDAAKANDCATFKMTGLKAILNFPLEAGKANPKALVAGKAKYIKEILPQDQVKTCLINV
ncbi:ethylene-responsive transcription factor erf106-like protein [Trifolium pratense]|uniref:Ethylene-responsive transcription factor erf106-like protein n=1 Tax=Trifolium pratense TaxID=57577 RepID=A0A2K3NJS3_TRIPR|nr:ethylene-responsive transcription factor erf106-like protein [Trifolium pratense]